MFHHFIPAEDEISDLGKEIETLHKKIFSEIKNIKILTKRINKCTKCTDRQAQQKAKDEYQASINKCHEEHSKRQCIREHRRSGKKESDIVDRLEGIYKQRKDMLLLALETAQKQLTKDKGEIKQKRQQRQKLLLHKKNEKKFI